MADKGKGKATAYDENFERRGRPNTNSRSHGFGSTASAPEGSESTQAPRRPGGSTTESSESSILTRLVDSYHSWIPRPALNLALASPLASDSDVRLPPINSVQLASGRVHGNDAPIISYARSTPD